MRCAAVGEVTHYNVLEGLTRIEENGSVAPLLAHADAAAAQGAQRLQQGQHGLLLGRVIVLQRHRQHRGRVAAQALPLTSQQINWAHLQALAWADAITQA